jgi:hypothetical protein
MKRTIACLFLAITLASAETLTLTSAGPANDGAYYTALYGLTVADPPNPPTPPIPILGLCLSAAVEVSVGESWQATLLPLTEYEAVAGLTAQQGDELAWLYTQIAANPVPAQSDAVWTIAGVPVNNAGAANIAYWVSQAQTNYPSINPALFQVWTPENSSGVIDLTVAQPDMVDSSAVPEPAAFTLTGIALIGFAWRRKSAR